MSGGMPGVCTEAADPNQHSLRFRPHGAAYECWMTFYGFDQNTNSGHPPTVPVVNIARAMKSPSNSTQTGAVETYHSYYGCIHDHACSRRDARLLWSREASTSSSYVKIDHNFSNHPVTQETNISHAVTSRRLVSSLIWRWCTVCDTPRVARRRSHRRRSAPKHRRLPPPDAEPLEDGPPPGGRPERTPGPSSTSTPCSSAPWPASDTCMPRKSLYAMNSPPMPNRRATRPHSSGRWPSTWTSTCSSSAKVL